MTTVPPTSLAIEGFVSADGLQTVKNYFDHYQIADIDTMNFNNNTIYVSVKDWYDNSNSRNALDLIEQNGYVKMFYDHENYFIVSTDHTHNSFSLRSPSSMYSVSNNEEQNDTENKVEYREDVVARDNSGFDDEGSNGSWSGTLHNTIENMKTAIEDHAFEMEKMKDYITESHRHIIHLTNKNTTLTKSVSLLKRAITNSHIQKTIAKPSWNGRLRPRK